MTQQAKFTPMPDAFKVDNKPSSRVGVTFTFLSLAALAVYAGYQNWTQIQTTVSVLPSDGCKKAMFTCKDMKGCLGQAVGDTTLGYTGTGLLNENVTVISKDASIGMYLCGGAREGVHLGTVHGDRYLFQGPASDLLVLDEGEFQPSTAVYNPTNNFAYIATNTAPTKVIKATLGTMERTVGVSLSPNAGFALTSVLVGQKMYVGCSTGRVVRVSVSGSGTNPPFQDAINPIWLGGSVVSSTKSPDGVFGLFGVAPSVPGGYGSIIEMNLATLNVTRTVMLQSTGIPSVLVEGHNHLVVGFTSGKVANTVVYPVPAGGFLQKIMISNFTIVGNLTAVAAPNFGWEWVSAGFAQPNGQLAMFGTTTVENGQPGHIVVIDIPSMTVRRLKRLNSGETSVGTATYVAVGQPPNVIHYGYFSINSANPRIVVYRLDVMKRTVWRDVENDGSNKVSVVNFAGADNDQYVFFGGGNGNSPGTVKRYPPDLGIGEKWGVLYVTEQSVVSNVVRIPPAPLMSQASVFTTVKTFINNTKNIEIGESAPLTPPTTLFPCELNTQERCCVVNGAALTGVITETFQYSWIAFIGAVGGFSGVVISVFAPLVDLLRGKKDKTMPI